jgi:tetratricopeptide (TPR) repeat protein
MAEQLRLASFVLSVVVVIYTSVMVFRRRPKGHLLSRSFLTTWGLMLSLLFASSGLYVYLDYKNRREALRSIHVDLITARGDYGKSLELRGRQEKIADALNDPKQELQATRAAGQLQMDHGDFPSARVSFLKALDIAQKNALHKETAHLYLNIGESYLAEARYGEAIGSLQKSLDVATEQGDNDGLLQATLALGDVMTGARRYSSAIEYYSKAKQLATSSGDRSKEFESLYGSGSVYSRLGKSDQALEDFSKAQALAHAIGDQKLVSRASIGVAEALYSQGKSRLAVSTLEQALVGTADPATKRAVIIQLASIYMDLGDWPKAEQVYTQLGQLGRDMKDKNLEAQAASSLATVARVRGDWTVAKAQFAESQRLYQEVGNVAAERALLDTLVIIYSEHHDQDALQKVRAALASLDRKATL